MEISGEETQSRLNTSSEKLDAWIEKQAFKGWDPHDALNSPVLKALTFGNRWLGIGWVQLLKKSPFNFRSILGIKKEYNPKGMGLFLESYLHKFEQTGKLEHLEAAMFFANWLYENISPDYSGACWGYNFDWPNRGFYAPKGTPTIINTAFIALAFLELYRISSAENSGLKIARSACDFILKDLNTFHPGSGELCFSYTPLDQRYIHNANLKGAELLAAVYAITNEAKLAEHAIAATKYTISKQLKTGAWYYGEAPRENWIDNFHTGFVLVSIKRIASLLDQPNFDEHLQDGYRYWKETFFLENGTPKYYAGKVYPIDIHSVAQAILTFLEFRDRDPEAIMWARKIATWGIENMQSPEGYFYYQIQPYYTNRIPYMRWGQAWMQRSLTELL